MRRSFWLSVSAALALVVVLGGLATVLLTEVAACQIAAFGSPRRHACAPGLWPVAWVPWALLAVVVGLVLSVATTAAVSGWKQLRRARRHVRALADAAVPVPPDLAEVAGGLGIGRLVLVDLPGFLAVTHGLVAPSVIVSSGLVDGLDRSELEAVLAHEAEHVRRRDPLRLLVGRALAAGLWLFPAIRDLAEHGALGSEITADRAATTQAGLRPLASALERILSAPAPSADAFAVSSIDGLRHRIRGLGRDEDPRLELSRRRLGLSVTSAAALVGVAALLVSVMPGGTTSAEAVPAEAVPAEAATVSDELLPVGDDAGDHVGWMRESDLAGPDGRVPVYDDDGRQVGWFEVGFDGGFVPLAP